VAGFTASVAVRWAILSPNVCSEVSLITPNTWLCTNLVDAFASRVTLTIKSLLVSTLVKLLLKVEPKKLEP